ncbi:hypothetical protein MNBD_GAMMA02-1725 [hydrothermal vent metagenome]|uniref:MalT-like TPR region domain-containing protein n=1 Tax=hydrothermal vent metagenome TaxID=652676 RepID=A0A3B0WB45_9ZZZZ
MYQNSVQLKQQRDKAEEQALIANKTTEFLTTLFQAASPLGNQGKDLDLVSVLEQGERQLVEGLGQQPKVIGALSLVMAGIQHHIDNTPKAIDHYLRAINVFQQANDLDGELTAIGQLAVMYFRNDDLKNSDRQFSAGDSMAERIEDPESLAWFLLKKATVGNERGQREQAAQYAEEALSLLKGTDENIALLGRLYSEWGQAIEFTESQLAFEFNEKALNYAARDEGEIHPTYLGRLSTKALRLMRLNRYDEAVEYIDETIAIAEKLYSDQHPKYASFLTSKVTYLHDKGYFKQAEQVYQKILSIYFNSYGKNNYDYARVTNNLAYLYEDQGQLLLAKELYRQSVELRIQLDSNNKIRVATAQSNFARVLAKLNQHTESAALVQQVMPVYAANKRSNLYNLIIKLANTFGDGGDIETCQQGKDRLQSLKAEIKKESAKGWRRLGAELWIAQMLKACQFEVEANMWLNSAYEMSKNIYQADSEGFKMIQQQVK